MRTTPDDPTNLGQGGACSGRTLPWPVPNKQVRHQSKPCQQPIHTRLYQAHERQSS